jgi:Dolichyl-phosphate-mannose-protein mannosyltransferase
MGTLTLRRAQLAPGAASLRAARNVVTTDLLPVALPAFLVSRALLLITGLWSVHNLPLKPGDGTWQDWQPPIPPLWVEIFSRWDSRWFYYVALQGYTYKPGEQSNLVFPPLLPALMRAGAFLQGRTDKETLLLAGVVAANVALLAALVCLSMLVRRLWDRPLAARAVVCLAAFPTSFFLSAAYSDSLFLACAIAAFVCALDGRWWAVGVLGGLAALSRTYGVLVLVPLGYEYLAQHRFRVRRDVAWLALIPVAFAVWLGAMMYVARDILVLPHVEQTWTREVMPPWRTFQVFLSVEMSQTNFKHAPIDFWFTIAALAMVAGSWLLRRTSLALYATLMVLPMVMTGLLVSNPRYTTLLFPGFIVLARLLRWRPLLAAYALAAGGFGLYLFSRFATGWWVA